MGRIRFISRYNDAYVCYVTAVARDQDTSTITIHLSVCGDESLGPLQRPSASTLTSDEFSVPLTSEEILEDTPRKLSAVLVYTCPLGLIGGALVFTFGSGGYSEVALEGV